MSEDPTEYMEAKVERPFHILREGFVAVNHSIARSPDLTVYEKVIYAILMGHLQNGKAWPSHSYLAEHTPCSVTQVKQTLKRLEQKLGLIIHRRTSARRVKLSNTYHFDEDAINRFIETQQKNRIEPASPDEITPCADVPYIGQDVPYLGRDVPIKKNHRRRTNGITNVIPIITENSSSSRKERKRKDERIETWNKWMGTWPNKTQEEAILAAVSDLPRFEKALEWCRMRGYSPMNVAVVLDRYAGGSDTKAVESHVEVY